MRVIWTFFVCLIFACFPLKSFAQSSLAEFEVEYASTYQLQKNYTIIYDNLTSPAKINEFKISFFDQLGEEIADVNVEHPENGKIKIHQLDTPIVGFRAIQIQVFSLHAGTIAELPDSLSSVLALSLDDEIPDAPDNAPPIANDAKFSMEAGETRTFDLSPFFSDDGDGLTLTPNNGEVEGVSFTLTSAGQLTVFSPRNTGTYAFTYRVQDAELETDIGQISIDVMLSGGVQDDLNALMFKLEALETDLLNFKNEASGLPPISSDIKSEIAELQSENLSLIATARSQENTDVEADIEKLTADLSQAVSEPDETNSRLESLQSQLSDKRREIETINTDGPIDIANFEQRLQDLNTELTAAQTSLDTIEIPKAISAADLDAWHGEHAALKSRLETTRNWPVLLMAIGLALSLFIGGLKFLGQKAKPKIKAKPQKPPQSGVIFANSPLFPSAVTPGPAPLIPAGHMAPSGLQTLTGSYSVLRPAYRATGRIGGPQEGVPTNDDVSFGTGFLITPNHIMTNRHVYEFYKHYLTGPDCGGIEFIAERGRDASDYVGFDGEPPLLISGLDIVIFKLTRAVTDRTPIDRVSIPTGELDNRDIVTISYPCPFEVDDAILSVVEEDPIFAVKRLSQGKVFRHSTDTDSPYGVEVSVEPQINPSKKLDAICHNASTLGGSSGAPILDLTGKLVGVHFAGDRAFNGEEAANLAMAIERLSDIGPKKDKPNV